MRPSAHALVERVLKQYPYQEPVVDIGGMEYVGWEGVRRVTMDMEERADVVADITNMPHVKPDAIGVYVCLDVLEHCKYPWLAIKELHRTLQPNGLLILSVPFQWEYHRHPEDYWRFSVPALRLLCEDFEELECDWQTEQFEAQMYDADNDKYFTLKSELEKSCCYFVGRKPLVPKNSTH